MDRFHVISLSHQTLDLDTLGQFHIEQAVQTTTCAQGMEAMGWNEIMMVSTCNRVEFYLVNDGTLTSADALQFVQKLYPSLSDAIHQEAVAKAQLFSGERAVEHLFRVAGSLESLVIGEREIITQVRNAFERFWAADLAGDFLRIVIRKAIETAKTIYTRTNIANKPVSVVNLAYRQIQARGLDADTRVVVVGAGQTNAAMVRNLKKANLSNITIYNRTLAKAEALAELVNGTAKPLSELAEHKGGFDVLITCTGASGHVITPSIYDQLLQGETDLKMVIDMALPQDLHPSIPKSHSVNWVGMTGLQAIAQRNLESRKGELEECEVLIQEALVDFESIFRARELEVAMKAVPGKVREIHSRAVNEVFARDLEQLDESSRQVVDNLLTYLEKKYISVPMKMAREILLEKAANESR